jgi:hypothetical protein
MAHIFRSPVLRPVAKLGLADIRFLQVVQFHGHVVLPLPA